MVKDRRMKYIVFYDHQLNIKEKRYVVTSCQSKAEYIMNVLKELGYKIDVISPSCTTHDRGFYRRKTYQIDTNIKVHLPATVGVHSFLGRIIRRVWQWMAINWFVYSRVEKGDIVIAYHSVSLVNVLYRLKKRKNIKLILHCEEIYSDVSQNNMHRHLENKIFKVADAFVFPTYQLNKIVNTSGKPYAVANGTYIKEKKVVNKYNDGKIHCVYAGTFNAIKGGVYLAIESARYLPEKYVIHVIGFGNQVEVSAVKESVEKCQKLSKCKIIYDGEKRGDEFKEYIQKCHIGLSTQNPKGEYNDTSFPSKILTYIANGLAVVSIELPVLLTSDVNEYLTYYNENSPQSLASAIMRCGESEATTLQYNLESLNTRFRESMSKVMESI